MKGAENILQERLDRLESGKSLKAVLKGLPAGEAILLKMAAKLRAIEAPEQEKGTVAAQRRRVLRAASQVLKGEGASATQHRPRWILPTAAASGAAALLVCALVVSVAVGLAWLRRTGGPPIFGPGHTTGPTSETSGPPGLLIFEVPNPQSAVLSEAKGVVEQLAANGTWRAVSAGEVLRAGQRIRTGALSSASLSFYDGSQAQLGPSTEVSLDALDAPKTAGPRVVQLTQWMGESDHEVVPSDHADSRYEVRTPSGTGTAKGTSFHVLVTTALIVRFNVDEGSVLVTSLNVTVVVVAGQSTTILPGSPPEDPVFRVSGEGEVGATGNTWRIAGHPFLTNSKTVILGDPQVGDWVAFEGRILSDGTRFADRIVLLHRAPENRFSFQGTIDSITETEWVIAGRAVQVNPQTRIEPGIEAGDVVKVMGVVLQDGTFMAEHIRLVEEAAQHFEFTGVIEAIAGQDWTISGISVTSDETTEIDPGLGVGEVVKVEGRILADGTWLAREIVRADEVEREFEFTGEVESIDPWIVAGTPLDTRPWTEIDQGIEIGDKVKVEGRVLDDGTWLATEIDRLEQEEPQRFKLVGEVTSLEPWIVAGTTLAVDDETEIEDQIGVGDTVRVRGRILPDGTWLAEEIERLDTQRGCLATSSAVRALEPSRIVLLNWQSIELDDEVEVEGEVKVASVVVVDVCVDEDGTITVVSISVIFQLEDLPAPRDHTRDHDDDDDEHEEDE